MILRKIYLDSSTDNIVRNMGEVMAVSEKFAKS